jgi:hypothetical protein
MDAIVLDNDARACYDRMIAPCSRDNKSTRWHVMTFCTSVVANYLATNALLLRTNRSQYCQ